MAEGENNDDETLAQRVWRFTWTALRGIGHALDALDPDPLFPLALLGRAFEDRDNIAYDVGLTRARREHLKRQWLTDWRVYAFALLSAVKLALVGAVCTALILTAFELGVQADRHVGWWLYDEHGLQQAYDEYRCTPLWMGEMSVAFYADVPWPWSLLTPTLERLPCILTVARDIATLALLFLALLIKRYALALEVVAAIWLVRGVAERLALSAIMGTVVWTSKETERASIAYVCVWFELLADAGNAAHDWAVHAVLRLRWTLLHWRQLLCPRRVRRARR